MSDLSKEQKEGLVDGLSEELTRYFFNLVDARKEESIALGLLVEACCVFYVNAIGNIVAKEYENHQEAKEALCDFFTHGDRFISGLKSQMSAYVDFVFSRDKGSINEQH